MAPQKRGEIEADQLGVVDKAAFEMYAVKDGPALSRLGISSSRVSLLFFSLSFAKAPQDLTQQGEPNDPICGCKNDAR